MKYEEVYARVLTAGFPPLNENYIRYGLQLGIVRWMVRLDKKNLTVRKSFKCLEDAKKFRDLIINEGYDKDTAKEFIEPKPKNRNLVSRPYGKREYTGQDIILGPPVVLHWD